MTQTQKLKNEINRLSTNWSQAIDEVDGLLWKANEILNTFNNSDWNSLNTELDKWSDDELRILAETIINGDDGKNIVDDNYTFGKIFTLTHNTTSNMLLTNYIGTFLTENNVNSFELLGEMKIKLNELKEHKYLTENEYSDWQCRLTLIEQKASR